MTGFKRADRVGDQIRAEMADILLTKVRDPRIGFVTVTAVEVSGDLRHARIFLSRLDGDFNSTLEGLDRAKAFVRGELGRRIKLRFTPEISFHEDRSGEEAARILKLMDEVKEPRS